MAWFFIGFCFISLIILSYGVMLHGADFINNGVGKPFYERISEGGRKNFWKFFIVALPICFISKLLTRSPLWIGLYFLLTYAGIGEVSTYKFIGVFVLAAALSKVAEELNYYQPLESKEGKKAAAETAELFNSFRRAIDPQKYK